MSDKKIIAVTGATGAQGGGLVRAILADDSGEFAVRAITRHTESDKAEALAASGAEMVAADLDDVASLERAFEGAHGVFCLTNFWEHFSPEKEAQQVANLAQAANSAGVGHAIWSTLEDTRNWVPLDDDRMPTLMDNYKVPHSPGISGPLAGSGGAAPLERTHAAPHRQPAREDSPHLEGRCRSRPELGPRLTARGPISGTTEHPIKPLSNSRHL